MAQPISAQGWLLRIGSAAGIAGALLGMVGNLAHPTTPAASQDAEGLARTIADSGSWVPGETNAVTRIPSIIFPTVITLWLAWMGVLLLRRAPRWSAPSLGRSRPARPPIAPAAERHPSADRQVPPGRRSGCANDAIEHLAVAPPATAPPAR